MLSTERETHFSTMFPLRNRATSRRQLEGERIVCFVAVLHHRWRWSNSSKFDAQKKALGRHIYRFGKIIWAFFAGGSVIYNLKLARLSYIRSDRPGNRFGFLRCGGMPLGSKFMIGQTLLMLLRVCVVCIFPFEIFKLLDIIFLHCVGNLSPRGCTIDIVGWALCRIYVIIPIE